MTGILIQGATGSGKSSGSGKLFAESYLNAGFGGLVLCAKADERRLWEEYCRSTGRLRDLVVFGPEQQFRFNFIDHELNREGSGAGLTENIINLFSTVLEIAERGQGGSGKEGEEYWKRACRSDQLDDQVLAVFKTIKQPEQVRHWFSRALVERSKSERGESQEKTQQLQRELTLLRQQQTRLLNLRLLEEIDADTFANKGTELRDRIAQLALQVEATDRSRGEQADLAIKCFELSQTLTEKWLTADFATKRQILEIVFLNFKLDNTTLCYETRKPFDVLTEGLSVLSNRDGGI